MSEAWISRKKSNRGTLPQYSLIQHDYQINQTPLLPVDDVMGSFSMLQEAVRDHIRIERDNKMWCVMLFIGFYHRIHSVRLWTRKGTEVRIRHRQIDSTSDTLNVKDFCVSNWEWNVMLLRFVICLLCLIVGILINSLSRYYYTHSVLYHQHWRTEWLAWHYSISTICH